MSEKISNIGAIRKSVAVAAFLAFLALSISMAPQSAISSSFEDSSWCTIQLKGLVIESNIFFATVMPGDSLNIKVSPNVSVEDVEWDAAGGYLTGVGEERLYIAPKSPGRYPLRVTARKDGEKLDAVIQIFVLASSSRMENGILNGYDIGVYPDPSDRYDESICRQPAGFMYIEKSDADVHLTENYQVYQFFSDGGRSYPKYLLVSERLLLRLELITKEMRARGLMSGRFKIFSGFRPPSRNRSAGQAKFSRHMYGDAADIVIDDTGSKGTMDDLNHDGTVDLRDGLALYGVVDRMEADGSLKGIEGGVGAYPGNKSYGPFVHIDWRGGKQARWVHDESGKRVKDIATFLNEYNSGAVLPERKVSYSNRADHTYSYKPSTANHYSDNYKPKYSSSASSAVNVDTMKENIKGLEKEVIGLEERWGKVDGGPKPVGEDDLYLAADVINESMLLNRGKVIIRRMNIREGGRAKVRADGITRIYSTPEGILQVRAKAVEPIWFHPEWSFLGAKSPQPVSVLRSKFFSNGGANKALDLGAGMRIHTATSSNFVLPGCIGVSDTDMNSLRDHTSTGTRVYLYEGGAYVPSMQRDSKKKLDLIALQSFLTLRRRAAELNRDHLEFDMRNERGWIKKGDEVVRALSVRIVGPCFSKAYPKAEERFKMPRGIMFVQSRDDFPVWYKPDWMYEDQKKPVPPPMAAGRIQNGLLGQYGFYLGGGIVIHGRHDKLLPEKAIDYVAIEVGDDDLKWIWKKIPQGGVVILR